MSVITKIRSVYVKENGYHETPYGSNLTKYGKWYGMNGVAWCAIFLSWVMHQAGIPTSVVPKHSYTPSGAQWFKSRGQWHSTPRVGDIAYYDLAGLGRISHVGWVTKVYSDGTWDSWEGNTDAAGGRTGGRVMKKRRSSTGSRGGFGRPKYPGHTSSPAPSSGGKKKSSKGILGMSKSFSIVSKIKQKLVKGKYKTLKLNKKGDVSLLTCNGSAYAITVWVRLSGLKPGQTLHVRGIVASKKKGTKTKIVSTYPVSEFAGSSGDSFAEYVIVGKQGKGKGGRSHRLRVQAWTDSKTATVKEVVVKGLKG